MAELLEDLVGGEAVEAAAGIVVDEVRGPLDGRLGLLGEVAMSQEAAHEDVVFLVSGPLIACVGVGKSDRLDSGFFRLAVFLY